MAATAQAQQGVLAKWSYIPTVITMPPAGNISGEQIPLRWNCGPSDTSALAIGTPIIRQVELNGRTMQLPSTVTAAERIGRKTVPVDSVVRRVFRGTLFVDKAAPHRLRVNPYLWGKAPEYLRCDPIPGSVIATSSVEDRLRATEFFYELDNRQTVGFRTIAFGFSGVTVPLRYRPGYKAANGAQISGAVADPLSIGVMFGGSYSRLRYEFVRHADNPLRESVRWTLGTVALLGKGTVGASTSMSAAVPATADASFLTLSTGIALTANFRGVEIGAYTAPEYPLQGGVARKWDYRGKWWGGLGLSFVPGN